MHRFRLWLARRLCPAGYAVYVRATATFTVPSSTTIYGLYTASSGSGVTWTNIS